MKKKLLSARKRNYKTRMAMALAFALTLSLSSPMLTGIEAFAAQVPVNEELTTPFGQMAEYDAEQGIGVVCGAAGYELYTVTISCEATGYEKVYADQTVGPGSTCTYDALCSIYDRSRNQRNSDISGSKRFFW